MALKSKVRVQPIVVQKYHMIDHKQRKFGSGKLRIKVFPPMDFIENESAEEYAERARQLMTREFQKLNENLTASEKF